MTLYSWTHWFWITTFFHLSMTASFPLSSFETISTSLKSTTALKSAALIQSDFSKPSGPQKYSQMYPLNMNSNDEDQEDVFEGGSVIGGAGEFDIVNAAKYREDWLAKQPILSDKKTLASVKLKKDEQPHGDLLSVLVLNNNPISSPNTINTVNTANPNNSTSTNLMANVTTVATTVLSGVTESGISTHNSTTTPTTKLRKVELETQTESERTTQSIEQLDEAKINVTSDISDFNQNESNDTMDEIIVMSENATELAEISERRSKVLTGYEPKVVNNISSRSTIQIDRDDKLSSEALFVTDEDNGGIMNAGVISGICVGVIGVLSALSATTVYIYRRRFLNKPQVLNDGQDSSGYIDDSIKDNSDEMYSLDNDSFLNSLEAMTIQNYWTDSVKHTKL